MFPLISLVITPGCWWKTSDVFRLLVSVCEYSLTQIWDLVRLSYGSAVMGSLDFRVIHWIRLDWIKRDCWAYCGETSMKPCLCAHLDHWIWLCDHLNQTEIWLTCYPHLTWLTPELLPHLVSGVPGDRQRDLGLLAGNNVFSVTTKESN